MRLYNTLTRKIEDFTPQHAPKVQMFVCGPTVYDFAHIGNAKTYIQMDTLARTLRFSGYDVFYLQNITDIDDKIINRAAERQVDWQQLRSQYEAEYKQDMFSLSNTAVSEYARATDYIPDIIKQVEQLVQKGHAYQIEDGIYFEISTFPEYGKLSGRREIKQDDAQTRIDHSAEKRGWNDFCLWKFSKAGEPSWPAPFGDGRPGWHIEDTAISAHFFGPQYDIHGGAIDLIFPHHEAEITQMESASGLVPFVRYWTHAGFLNIADSKMSKSAGNFHTIRSVIEKGYDPLALRMLMLQSHYRSTINFSWELLEAATHRLDNWRSVIALRWQLPKSAPVNFAFEDHIKRVSDYLTQDLNTPEALSAVDAALTAFEKQIISGSSVDQSQLITFITALDDLFGLDLLQLSDISDTQKELIAEREAARDSKDWDKADELRAQLANQHIGLRDAADGAVWYRLNPVPSAKA